MGWGPRGCVLRCSGVAASGEPVGLARVRGRVGWRRAGRGAPVSRRCVRGMRWVPGVDRARTIQRSQWVSQGCQGGFGASAGASVDIDIDGGHVRRALRISSHAQIRSAPFFGVARATPSADPLRASRRLASNAAGDVDDGGFSTSMSRDLPGCTLDSQQLWFGHACQDTSPSPCSRDSLRTFGDVGKCRDETADFRPTRKP